MRHRLPRALTLVAILTLALVPLRASDPVGCYAIVERVVLQPDSSEPATIQIFGAFALSTAPGTGNNYNAVQTGYLYFTCAKGKDSACVAEWNDLKKLSGTGAIVGFGNRYGKTTMRVRPATEKVASPDEYPLNIGLQKMGDYAGITYPDVTKALKAAVAKK